MSLYETFYSPAVVMHKTKVPDGVGGFVNGWTEGAEISAAFSSLTPTERIAAQQASVAYTDTIVTPVNTNLDEQDIIKADGIYYLVVSKLPKTPSASTFQPPGMAVQVMCAAAGREAPAGAVSSAQA